MRLGVTRFVCVVVAMLYAVAALAEMPVALLHSRGIVTVNGNAVPGSTTVSGGTVVAEGTIAVFAGDKVQTLDTGSAVISFEGFVAMVGPKSQLAFKSKSDIELTTGSVRLTNEKSNAGKVLTITTGKLKTRTDPSGKTNLEITRTQGKIAVKAIAGTLTVFDGSRESVLQPGVTAVSDDEPQQSPPASAGAPPELIYAAGIGGAVAATVVTWLTTRNATPASPVRP
jgi:hypothetical protein